MGAKITRTDKESKQGCLIAVAVLFFFALACRACSGCGGDDTERETTYTPEPTRQSTPAPEEIPEWQRLQFADKEAAYDIWADSMAARNDSVAAVQAIEQARADSVRRTVNQARQDSVQQVHALIDEVIEQTGSALNMSALAYGEQGWIFRRVQELAPEVCLLVALGAGQSCEEAALEYQGLGEKAFDMTFVELDRARVTRVRAEEMARSMRGMRESMQGIKASAQIMQESLYQGGTDQLERNACAERRYVYQGEDIRYLCLSVYYEESRYGIDQAIEELEKAEAVWGRVAAAL